MTPHGVRRALHWTHAGTTLLLLATGLLLEFPELRRFATGGYAIRLVSLHSWSGVAFALAPVAALALAGRALIGELLRRLGPPDPWRWREYHLAGSIAATGALSASGVLLWIGDAWLPIGLWDASRGVHVAAGWAIAVSLPLHLVAARHKIRARIRAELGLAEPDALLDIEPD
jgi:cytochrome b subunit of formate dehydrogenase